MRIVFYILTFVFFSNSTFGQSSNSWIEGNITFVTGKYVYVKFDKTNDIKIGDSLFISVFKNSQPALVVSKKSSISILCEPIVESKFDIGQIVYYKLKSINKVEDIENSVDDELIINNKISIINKNDSISKNVKKQKISGRTSVGSYSNLPDYNSDAGNHRMRYIISFKGANIKQTNLYFDTYVSYNQTFESDFKLIDRPNDKFKFYRFSGGYASESIDVSFGRQIKNKISALGSFDGLYFQKKIKNNLYTGVIAGTRPDYEDYGLNLNLFQYGAFINYYPDYKISSTNGTFAFFEQQNEGNVDRRFLYFQIASTLSKFIRFFAASEVDLFQIKDGITSSKPKLTSIYGNIRFNISKKINASIGVDSRKNRIYFETYKDFLETLLERETRQGLRFRLRYSPIKKLSLSATTNFRYTGDELSSSYYNLMINYRSLPFLKMPVSISVSNITTNYIKSETISLRFSKKVNKRINVRVSYKYYQYYYNASDSNNKQNRIGLNVDLNLKSRIYFNIYFEKTIQKERNFSHLNLRLSKRF